MFVSTEGQSKTLRMITINQLLDAYKIGDEAFGKGNYQIVLNTDDVISYVRKEVKYSIESASEAGWQQTIHLLNRLTTNGTTLEELTKAGFENSPYDKHMVKKTMDDFEVCYKVNVYGVWQMFAIMRRLDYGKRDKEDGKA
jgi:hypothetical protein